MYRSKSTKSNRKFREWLSRYSVAELFGTLVALGFAYISFTRFHSYIIASGAGFVGEGIGFYGYFIARELYASNDMYRSLPLVKRLTSLVAKSSTNLITEFAPAEIIDTIVIRPFLMYYVPQHVRPYVVGFGVGKILADMIFYIFAIIGYETSKRRHR